jgi:hypothetical protein
MKAFVAAITLFSGACLADGKGFWSSTSASWSDIVQEAYLIGNGRLGGKHFAQ